MTRVFTNFTYSNNPRDNLNIASYEGEVSVYLVLDTMDDMFSPCLDVVAEA